MNLTIAPVGQPVRVIKVKEKDKQQRFLTNLGFVEGTEVIVVSEINGNIIVKVKESRVAVGKELARRVIVSL